MGDAALGPADADISGFPITPDPARVLLRPFMPAAEVRSDAATQGTRANQILDRMAALDDDTASRLLADVLARFGGRHRDLLHTLEQRAEAIGADGLTGIRRQLAGAYFLMEYSFESAALFNPSMVAHPDQAGAPPGGRRIVLSLRAVGEGHVSSLTFRSGTIGADGRVVLDPAMRLASRPRELSRAAPDGVDTVEFAFDPRHDLSERVIFPMTEAQSNGIEDARFVALTDELGCRYCATFTAYDGRRIQSQLIETTDFTTFRMIALQGTAARNKGMALFPRKVGGRYAMISREDTTNLYLVWSDDLHIWNDGVVILRPRFDWELVQLGNCGSPIELDEGWLLFIHGVGPMRTYAIGAVLLDKTDPARVIARTREPLLRPPPEAHGGYVPNVVYSCGAMRHGDTIILPYGLSDRTSEVTSLSIATVLQALGPV